MSNHPKIGIRPTIDGRMNGVRESLEDQTMGMAQAVANLLQKKLRYEDGAPVECVIADSTIGRVAETAACAEKFAREGVAVTITVTPCWCYGSETMDMDPHTIKAVWGFNGTERPGAVYLAAVLAAHAQKGLPAFGIYGHEVQDVTDGSIPGDVREKLLRFGRAAVAAAQAEGTSYLQIGSACMGIAGSQITCSFFEDYLGMRVESVDEVEILRRIDKGIYDRELYEKALEWTKKNCPLGFDKNPEFIRSSPGQKEKDLEFSVKCAVIIQDLMSGNPRLPAGCEEEAGGHNAIAAGFQGQRQWTDWLPNADFAEAVCNSSFDWNGAREPFVLATENDTLNCASMLLMKLLTNRAQLFADVRTCWSAASVERVTGYRLEGKAAEAGGIIHLINSGAAALDWTLKSKENGKPAVKPWYDVTDEDIAGMLSATDWCPADNGYFRGGGFSSHFVTEEEVPCTMMRINIVRGLGPVAQIAEGWTVKLPAGVTKTLWDRTDPTWPCTWFAPRCDGKEGSPFRNAYDVMNNWGANHGAISYGHIGADLITMASMLRIPVCMHNVPLSDIFRPAAWNAFGSDKEGADYRACAAYGPLYKTIR